MSDKEAIDPSKSVVKWMYYIIWTLGLLISGYFFQSWIDYRENPNQIISSSKNTTITLKQNRRGHYLAKGTINGVQVTFLLDTGATQVSVPLKLAESAGLKQQGTHLVSTANGVIEVYQSNISEIKIGKLTMTNVSANINPFMTDNTVLLGMSFLKQFDLLQRNKKLTLSIPIEQ